MANFKRNSGFAPQIDEYIEFRTALGIKPNSDTRILNVFDRFCSARGITSPVFTQEDADAWVKHRNGEAQSTHYARVNTVKHFLTYLALRDYDVFVVKDIRWKAPDFSPHIYTDEETDLYFRAVDSCNGLSQKDALQYPVIFRILYCCGTRVGETLSIRKCDIDLETGVILLKHTKRSKERYVVVGPDMKVLLMTYAEKCFHLIEDEGLIFTNSRGNKIDAKRIYKDHRQFLREAGIPFHGAGKGPRLHDWRHHFAIYAFKKMGEMGFDMYAALPILAAYLGHSSIRGTEQYIRLATQHFPIIGEKIKDKVKAIFGEMKNEEN